MIELKTGIRIPIKIASIEALKLGKIEN